MILHNGNDPVGDLAVIWGFGSHSRRFLWIKAQRDFTRTWLEVLGFSLTFPPLLPGVRPSVTDDVWKWKVVTNGVRMSWQDGFGNQPQGPSVQRKRPSERAPVLLWTRKSSTEPLRLTDFTKVLTFCTSWPSWACVLHLFWCVQCSLALNNRELHAADSQRDHF